MGQAVAAWGDYGPGIYFTTDHDEAVKYARKSYKSSGKVYSCDIVFENPLPYHVYVKQSQMVGGKRPLPDGAVMVLISRGIVSAAAAIRSLQRFGYDGIVAHFKRGVENVFGVKVSKLTPVAKESDADVTYYIVFDPASVMCVVTDA